MNLLQWYQRAALVVMRIFRWDLQLHFFWGFILTLLGVYWPPLYAAGIVVTVVKEGLDLWSKKLWSWDDVWLGIIGSLVALGYLWSQGIVIFHQ
ncbi:MAG: hypothetical protein D3916_07390 [Candidatus Electrothrix sp. MAN1_4]|nr:hypothetical protein [Candidatus Electrothrix sp. MAN1_4]